MKNTEEELEVPEVDYRLAEEALTETEEEASQAARERRELRGLSPKAERVANILNVLSKTSRSFVFYNPNNEAIKRFLNELYSVLTDFLTTEASFRLIVRPYEFYYRDERVYLNTNREQSFAFKLYRDGIRELQFVEGLTWDEMVRFLDIVSIRYSGIHQMEEDIVTLLWKADFTHITYLTVEGFFHEITDEEVEDSAAKVTIIMDEMLKKAPKILPDMDFLGKGGRLMGGKGLAEKGEGPGEGMTKEDMERLEEDAEEIIEKMGDPEDIDLGFGFDDKDFTMYRGEIPADIIPFIPVSAEKSDVTFSSLDDKTLQDITSELSMENLPLNIFRLLDYLFMISKKKEELLPFTEVLSFLEEIRDHFLFDGKINHLNRLIIMLNTFFDDKERRDSTAGKEVEQFLSTFREKRFIARVISAFEDEEKGRIPPALSGFFFLIGDVDPEMLFQIIEEEDTPGNMKRLIGNLLITITGKDVRFFAKKMHHPDTSIVLIMLRCLDRIGTEEATEQITRTLVHPLPEVRLETMNILLKKDFNNTIAKAAVQGLNDRDRGVILRTLDVIEKSADKRFVALLMEKINSKHFREMEPEERDRMCQTLAKIGTGEVVPFFGKGLRVRRLLRRIALDDETRLSYAKALALIGDEASLKYLKRYKKKGNEEFRLFAARSILDIKKRLLKEKRLKEEEEEKKKKMAEMEEEGEMGEDEDFDKERIEG